MVFAPEVGVLEIVLPWVEGEGTLGGVGVCWPYWSGLCQPDWCPQDGGGGGKGCIIPVIPHPCSPPWDDLTEGNGEGYGCDNSPCACDIPIDCWDKPGCPGGTIIDCWDGGTSGGATLLELCWFNEKVLGYCLGGGKGAPDPIGRCHTGKPTKFPGPRDEVGGRTGDLDLSMNTMSIRGGWRNLMLRSYQSRNDKVRWGEQPKGKEPKREGKGGQEKQGEGKEKGKEGKDESKALSTTWQPVKNMKQFNELDSHSQTHADAHILEDITFRTIQVS